MRNAGEIFKTNHKRKHLHRNPAPLSAAEAPLAVRAPAGPSSSNTLHKFSVGRVLNTIPSPRRAAPLGSTPGWARGVPCRPGAHGALPEQLRLPLRGAPRRSSATKMRSDFTLIRRRNGRREPRHRAEEPRGALVWGQRRSELRASPAALRPAEARPSARPSAAIAAPGRPRHPRLSGAHRDETTGKRRAIGFPLLAARAVRPRHGTAAPDRANCGLRSNGSQQTGSANKRNPEPAPQWRARRAAGPGDEDEDEGSRLFPARIAF